MITKIFFDTEFTGLHQNTTLISIGMVAEDGREFYGICDDYNKNQVDQWLEENVISSLSLYKPTNVMYCMGHTKEIAGTVTYFLEQYSQVEMWGDCLAYDWVLFCQMFGGALMLPKNIYYIPFDICTLFKIRGYDPDSNREAFAGVPDSQQKKHNALFDARILQYCYQRLIELR